MMRSALQDEEDHNETFGSMFDAEVELKQVDYRFGGVEFSIKSSHLYFGKTCKFMPLTVWPACSAFLRAFLAALDRTDASLLAARLAADAARGGPVLELGAGTGMLSVVLSRLCADRFAEVVSTDSRSSSLELMEFNREKNGVPEEQMRVAALLWQEEEAQLPAEHRARYGLVLTIVSLVIAFAMLAGERAIGYAGWLGIG